MDTDGGESWFDQDAGPLIRPFAMTRGRVAAERHALDMITLVVAVRPAPEVATLNRESAAIVAMCRSRPVSVAEIAAELNVLLVVAKVLVGDLIDDGYLVRQPSAPRATLPDMELLQAVLDGVRRL